jgi:hypothetical protein
VAGNPARIGEAAVVRDAVRAMSTTNVGRAAARVASLI